MNTKIKHHHPCDYFHFRSSKSLSTQALTETVSTNSPITLKTNQKSTILASFIFVFSVLVIYFTFTPSSSFAEEVSVPAQFVMRIQPPGSNNDFLRPSDIFIDDYNSEVFVADPGKNRVLIFDSTGIFKFEFEGAGYFSSPLKVVVDSEGYIYVLGSKREGRLVVKFDFDGLYLTDLIVPTTIEDHETAFSSMTIDNQDHLYLYDSKSAQICVFDTNGNLLNQFNVLPDEDAKMRSEVIVNSFIVENGFVYVPMSNLGMVRIYDTQGNSVRGFGRKGNNTGSLNFPVSVQIIDNVILVLDKHRINVVCFSLDGKFLGEFGGKGSSPGWFYHPTLLEVNNQNQVYVGQIYENKIQLCQIPQFILDKANGKKDVL